ncbi:MAG: hypothetical protein AAF544_07410 [Bacteroidota bacterium]
MISRLIKFGLLAAVVIVGYNYFYGDEEEQQQSREVVNRGVDLGRGLWTSLRGAVDKLRDGEYDGVLNRIGDVLDDLGNKARELGDSDVARRLTQLEQRQEDLQNQERQVGSDDPALQALIDRLTADTEKLMNEIDPDH